MYLFGSRADDGLAVLTSGPASLNVSRAGGDGDSHAAGSDLDVGVLLKDKDREDILARLQVAFEDVFAPLRVDLVPLDRVDALFQYRAIDGHRVYAHDAEAIDRWELLVMRRAADLLPVQRRIERDLFGVSSS